MCNEPLISMWVEMEKFITVPRGPGFSFCSSWMAARLVLNNQFLEEDDH